MGILGATFGKCLAFLDIDVYPIIHCLFWFGKLTGIVGGGNNGFVIFVSLCNHGVIVHKFTYRVFALTFLHATVTLMKRRLLWQLLT